MDLVKQIEQALPQMLGNLEEIEQNLKNGFKDYFESLEDGPKDGSILIDFNEAGELVGLIESHPNGHFSAVAEEKEVLALLVPNLPQIARFAGMGPEELNGVYSLFKGKLKEGGLPFMYVHSKTNKRFFFLEPKGHGWTVCKLTKKVSLEKLILSLLAALKKEDDTNTGEEAEKPTGGPRGVTPEE